MTTRRHLMRRAVPRLTAQRGAMALAVVMLLYAALAIAVVFVHRSLVFEQRAAANQVRAAIAHEAAEAGLDWATVRLRDAAPLAADCLPSVDGRSFFETHLAIAPDGVGLMPRASGVAVAACIAPTGGGWACRCAPAGEPATAPSGTGPGFAVELAARAGARMVDVVSLGCGRGIPGPGCSGDARAGLRVTLALRPALAASPGAALTVRGTVSTGAASLGVHNPDAASGGVALRAGAGVDAPALRVQGPAGTPASAALVTRDDALATLDPSRLFLALFGVPRDTWRESFADALLDCPCDSAAVSEALARGARKLWLRGDLVVDSTLVAGSETAPLIVVVDGTVRLTGPLRLQGLLHAGDIEGPASPAGMSASARVDGAVVSAAHWRGATALDLVYDPQVLARLRALPGTFVRVPGSWRDDAAAP
jgi:hypothetical protein